MKVSFNIPLVIGDETAALARVIDADRFSGNGEFSKQCAAILKEKIGSKKAIMTSSCTDALEMSALLCDLGPEDEVIMPSYTFVSTASAFALRGVNIVWCDIRPDTKNIDETKLEALVTEKTRVIVVVHYGGVGCEMDAIVDICRRHNLKLVEDAAQAIDCTYNGTPLGSIGDLATLSFHETKNVQCGEGGALLVNDPELVERAEILRDKGTNRSRFLKGLVDKYTWVDLGSSFLMSELQASFLSVQLSASTTVNGRRSELWNRYYQNLKGVLPESMLPVAPSHCVHNGHLFYVMNESLEDRQKMIAGLKSRGISAVFHYVPLHQAPYWDGKYDDADLPVTRTVADGLLRLPMHYTLKDDEVDYVCNCIKDIVR